MNPILKIGISGPESSGKTALASALSRHFAEPYVPEYARLYLCARGSVYTAEDIHLMEQGQLRWEREAESLARQILFCDTDHLVFRIWKKYKAPHDTRYVLPLCHFHFICKPDIPWAYDPLREHPQLRDQLFTDYLSLADQLNVKYAIVEGNFPERISLAVKKVTECLAAHY